MRARNQESLNHSWVENSGEGARVASRDYYEVVVAARNDSCKACAGLLAEMLEEVRTIRRCLSRVRCRNSDL